MQKVISKSFFFPSCVWKGELQFRSLLLLGYTHLKTFHYAFHTTITKVFTFTYVIHTRNQTKVLLPSLRPSDKKKILSVLHYDQSQMLCWAKKENTDPVDDDWVIFSKHYRILFGISYNLSNNYYDDWKFTKIFLNK